MGKDQMAREQARLDRPRGWRIAAPGLATLVLGLASLIAQGTSLDLLWPAAVLSLVLVGLIVWTAVALAKTGGRHPLARTAGIAGIVVAGLGVFQSLGFILAMVLLAGAV